MTDTTGGGGQGGSPDRKRDFRLVGIGIAAVLLIWFALDNLQRVPINFWVTSAKTSAIVVIIISGVLGAVITLLVQRRRRPSKKS